MTHFNPSTGPLPVVRRKTTPELYGAAHKNFTVGYADVVLNDPESGRFFFPIRGVEPEKGSRWFIGGRVAVGETVEQSAARHVQHDVGLTIAAGRFIEISHFSIAHLTEREGQEPLVRHAMDNVLVASLTPGEVRTLSHVVSSGEMNSEYSGGGWYDPQTDKEQTLPGPLRQFLRDYFSHEVMITGLHAMAIEEGQLRSEAVS